MELESASFACADILFDENEVDPIEIDNFDTNMHNCYPKTMVSEMDVKLDENHSELDSNSSLASNCTAVNELSQIPRNKIGAFKTFRKGTFKLVPTDDFSSCLIKNSNNSNKFVKTPCKVSHQTSEEAIFINRINKNVMMRKITEIASPYLHEKTLLNREFKRIIPHPIFDDQRNTDLLNITFLANKNNGSTKTNPQLTKSNEIKNRNSTIKNNNLTVNPLNEVTNRSINLEDYEKMLQSKLNEIRMIKNSKDNTIKESQDNYSYNDTNKSMYQQPSHPIVLNEREINSSLEKGNILTSNAQDSSIFSSNEILVEVDEKEEQEQQPKEIKEQQENSHIPLFFRNKSGKKLRFKIRIFNQMGQAMKAYCNRMSIELMSNCQFYLANGQMIYASDTPFNLALKPQDTITVQTFP